MDDERDWVDGDGAPAEGTDGGMLPPAECAFPIETPYGPRPTAHAPYGPQRMTTTERTTQVSANAKKIPRMIADWTRTRGSPGRPLG